MVSSVRSGQILGDRYQVLQVLGENRFGHTYLVEDTHSNGEQRTIAELMPRIHGSGAWERAVALFEQEAALVRDLDHPQLPKFRELFFSYENDRERVFWVQDYCPGQSLRALLNARWVQGRNFSEREAAQLLQRLLPVLDYLHHRGIIHRNISPDAIVLNPSAPSPALVDFGGVKQVVLTLEQEFAAPGTPPTAPPSPPLGEPGYAPPEQLEKGIVYTYSDLYALAMVALVMVTGQEPLQLRCDPQTHALQWDTRRSSELLALLARMLAPRPSDRYQTASELQAALAKIHLIPATPVRSPDDSAKLAPPPAARVRPLLTWLLRGTVTLGFIAGAGAIGWFVGRLWLGQQLREPEVVELPDLDLSPTVAPAETVAAPEELSFPPIEEPEPDPPAALPAAERQRRLALRDRRRDLAVGYPIYQDMVAQLYRTQYPERAALPSVEPADAAAREDYDAIASRLLDVLATLRPEARSRLGDYRKADRERWQDEARALEIPATALNHLVTSRFKQAFPTQPINSIGELGEQPLGQVWNAIAAETIEALRSEQAQRQLVLPESRNTLQVEGSLAPGAGQVFTALLGENQWLALTAAANEQPLELLVYGPDGKLLVKDATTRAWSGRLPQAGHYAIALVSQSSQPLDYQLNFTVKNP